MRKALAALLIGTMTLSLAACGAGDDASEDDLIYIDTAESDADSYAEDYDSRDDEQEDGDETSTSSSAESETDSTEKYPLTEEIRRLDAIVNQYAYVDLESDTSALINTDGEVVRVFDRTWGYDRFEWIDENTLILTWDKDTIADARGGSGPFVVLSVTDGVLYDSTQDSEHDWSFLGSQNGEILVQQFSQGFNQEDGYEAACIDLRGNVVSDWVGLPDEIYYHCEMGNGLVWIEDHMYDFNTHTMFEVADYYNPVGPFVNGTSLTHDAHVLYEDGTLAEGEIVYLVNNGIFRINEYGYKSGQFGPIQEGLVPDKDGRYRDTLGNVVISLDEYRDRYDIEAAYPFAQGHACVQFVDKSSKKNYYGVIDTSGNLMYEPLYLDEGAYNFSKMFACNGGFWTGLGSDLIYDWEGQPHNFMVDDLSFLPDDLSFVWGNATGGRTTIKSYGVTTMQKVYGCGVYFIPQDQTFYRKDGTVLEIYTTENTQMDSAGVTE